MKFIAILLITLLCIPLNGLSYSQNTYACNPDQPHAKAVCLDGKLVFWLDGLQKVDGLTPAERVKEINERIKDVADNANIKLEDLTIESWQNGRSSAVRAPTAVLLTLLDEDVKALKISPRDKGKLISQYLERIKNAIRLYRNQNGFSKEALDNRAEPRDNASVIAGVDWVHGRQAARIR